MDQSQLITQCGSRKLSREELAVIPTPEGTPTHRPLPHHEIVEALIETLSFRHISVVRDEYAVSKDGMKMFGVMDLEAIRPDHECHVAGQVGQMVFTRVT